ncbi:unnamed protein product [Brachionus calyciflorus]|uniref:Uncharacterized protein n=1 Tax=Brachionus calyciflorus TaxID=104777 RepID=A0A814E5H0_9BILA|nr:unnamed protein product [Brachionus calyciflorus]
MFIFNKENYSKHRSLYYLISIPLILLIIPLIFRNKESYCAFTILLITSYWLSDCVHIAITALIPNILFPLFGILPSKLVSRVYFEDVVMLFVGSLILACALEITNIHERLALKLLIKTGSNPKNILLGLMIITSLISLWITNAAAVSLFLPIVQSILQEYCTNCMIPISKKPESNSAFDKSQLSLDDIEIKILSSENDLNQNLKNEEIDSEKKYCLTAAFFLGCTYSSTIGSLASLMKTPSNIMLKAFIDKYLTDCELNFVNFSLFSIPLSIILVFITWLFLSFYWIPKDLKNKSIHDENLSVILKERYKTLGPIRWDQKCIILLFVFLIFLWILTDVILTKLNKNITDTTPAILTAIILFMLPRENIFAGKPYVSLIDWKQLQQIFPWHTILLIGPVITIADALEASGLGFQLTETFGKLIKTFMLERKELALFLIINLSSLTTEFTSNTIITSIFFPIAHAIAKDLNVNSLYLLLPMSLSSCLGFMLPLASLNNFMSFGAGSLKMGDMIKTGLYVNVICSLVTYFYTNSMFGIIFHAK